METHPRPDTALVSNIIPLVILFIFVYGRLMMIIQVNTGVLDTVLLSFHPAEVKNYIWVIFPRTGKMSKICHFFLIFEASL